MTISTGQEWTYPGARWWKFDFHTHSPASSDYGKGANQDSLRQITPEDWLLGFMRAGIDCVAVTDHNSGAWIDTLKAALPKLEHHGEFRQLYLFPGVEITANGGTHILALFDPCKGSSDIDKLLGDVEYRGEPGASDQAAKEAPIGVMEAIWKSGGIPILAHVDGPSGAWKLRGNTLGPLLDSEGLFAMEVVDSDAKHPALYRQRRLTWAEVLGSDSHHPAGGTGERLPGSHYTWVKMGEPSREGLRLALLDGQGFSIRRSAEPEPFDPFTLPKHHIEAIEIRQARYMGRGDPAELRFSPWLNALVGGRGTGKSTVIHALRLASGREQELDLLEERSGPRLTFERFNRVPSNRMDKGGLAKSTEIRWTVLRDGVRYQVHRKGGDRSVREEVDGNWKPSSAQAVGPERLPIRMFNQGQIAELAGENQQALLQVIDEAADVAGLQRDLTAAKDAYYSLRARIRQVDGRLADRDALVADHEDVERKLKRFEEAGHTQILKTYRRRGRQRRETERQFDAAAEAAGRLEETAANLQVEDLPDGLFVDSAEDREATAVMDSLAAGVRGAAEDLRAAAQRLNEVVAAQRQALASSAWQASVDRAHEDYDRLVKVLREEGVDDPGEYSRLAQDRQRLDSELADLDSLKEERDRLVAEGRTHLRRVLQTRRAVSDARREFLSLALADNRFVRIQTRTYGDSPQALERSLREVLNVLDDRFQDDILVMDNDHPSDGIIARLLADLPKESADRRSELEARFERLKDHMEAACGGAKEHFGGHFSNYLERESRRAPELLDRLLTWFPEDGLKVEYSRRGDATDFQPIAQASAGQRSAAMLAFLLAHGEEPLVLDQPEDDLDNHLIYDLVVRQIRENKLRRQIIVVTHNPNIVVNGDAEMLHALEFLDGQCVVRQSGSLQEQSMREEVCRVMEGGTEAFRRRYRRLGSEPRRVQ